MQTTTKQTKGSLQLKEVSIIQITSAVGKSSSSVQSKGDEDSADLLRKKRCTDRYDSSESSDSGVITMSADSTATSDTSDPGSPFSHASTCQDDVSAVQNSSGKASSHSSSLSNSKTLKRQAQVTENCDKKRVRKELCSKNNNVEIKIIPVASASETTVQTSSAIPIKKQNIIKSTLAAISNLNVFKTQQNSSGKTLLPTPVGSSIISTTQQPPHLAQLSTSAPIAATISKLTDYYKLKKEVTNTLSMEKYCNMLLNLQSGGKKTSKCKLQDMSIAKHAATTITPITHTTNSSYQPQQLITTTKAFNVPRKAASEKKTAKIAPVIPVARKQTHQVSSMQQLSQSQPLKISPKKPVPIAPRIEPKPMFNSKNSILQPKTMTMAVNSVKPGMNGKLVATSTSSQQPTVLLAAIRIPSQQMQNATQPPPLKMQNGLMHKTTTNTTTSAKLAPMLQCYTQQMIPNLIQLPNLVATSGKPVMNKTSSASPTPAQPNIFLNSTNLTQQQQQQLFLNGAVIKLQQISPSQSNAQSITSSTISTVASMNNVAQKYAYQQQQQAFAAQLAAQQMQQLFMTTPVLFNTSSIPTVLTSQLAGLQHAFNQQQIASSMAPPTSMPALQPIQSSLLSSYSTSSMTSTTNSMQLPSISTILHNQGMSTQQFQTAHIHQHQLHQGIPHLMKTSASSTYNSMPPSLAISSGFIQNQQRIHASIPQQTSNNASSTIPPLTPSLNLPLNISKNFPKLVSVTSSSSQTSPKSPPPLVLNQKVSLPLGSPIVSLTPTLKKDPNDFKQNTICVVPPLPSPAKQLKVEKDIGEKKKLTNDEPSKIGKPAISIIIEEKSTIECAKSPILSQPKTIRFPPINGKVTVWKKCVKISKTGVCYWEKCSKHFDSNSDLLEHLHQHINAQQGPFMCSWCDCKVNGREGSKGWLERHVMSHVGSKPFKCIVERCGVRFSSQVQLEKHVNGHFNNSDQQTSSKRSSDQQIPKKVKKDQRKTKIRRQPWAARRFDFFDVGMMDILQYRLEKAESVIHGRDVEVKFRGRIIGKRQSIGGEDEYQVTWSPTNIVNDEWMRRPEESFESSFELTKNVSVRKMTSFQRNALQEHVSQITKRAPRTTQVRKSRKFSSTCTSSRTSVLSSST